MLLAPVDPCMGDQRASSEGIEPQHRIGLLRDLVDYDVSDLLRDGCDHEVIIDAGPTAVRRGSFWGYGGIPEGLRRWR